MSLLFDQNLSHRLVRSLTDLYPGSRHVRAEGRDRASDSQVRAFAAQHRLAIVTKDSDFEEFSRVLGAPPKVIRLAIGNAPTAEIERLLRGAHEHVVRFLESEDSLLVLRPGHA